MAWDGRDLKECLVPNPCYKQSCHPLDQVADQLMVGLDDLENLEQTRLFYESIMYIYIFFCLILLCLLSQAPVYACTSCSAAGELR